jgi:hypothetical protein
MRSGYGELSSPKGKVMEFLRSLTPEFFDTLIIIVIIIGLAAAAVRLYSDFTRPLPENHHQENKQP